MPKIDTDTEEGKAELRKLIDAETEGLKNKNNELLGDNKKIKETLKTLQDHLDVIQKEKDETEAAAAAKSGDLEKLKSQLEAKHKKELSDRDALIQSKDGVLHKLLVDNALTEALTKAGVSNPAHLKAAKAMILAENKAEVSESDGQAVASISGKSIADFVTTFAQGEDGKHFVSAPANGGGGANGSNGGGKAAAASGNMAGTPAERIAALQKKHPELKN